MVLPPFRSALALLLSAALAFPAAAQQVPESDAARLARERQGLALGLGALAAIGILLREQREDREEEEAEEEERQRQARTLPARCLVTWGNRDNAVRLYDPDCLDRAFPAAARLPLSCAVTVRSEGRFVSGFSPACLREEGWRTPE